MEDLTVDIEKTINAPIERVFDAWLDPELLSRFMLPMPGMKNPRVTCDPREGGNFEILMYVGENEVPHTGRYLEVDRPHRLAFSWVSPASRDDSVVTLTFAEAALSAFSVAVSCNETTHTEGTTPVTVYQLTAIARSGTFGTLDYVQRRLQVTVSRDPP